MDSIPVGIISGFLGAGKTTLLNHLLQGAHGRRIAVLVNDFGEINIDAQLIAEVTGETISLANGCVCCTIRDDLVEAVQQLCEGSPPPEHILVETSGVSEPAAAAMGIASAASLSGKVKVDAIISVVDAEHLPTLSGEQRALAIDQIEPAHIVLLNKTDLATPAMVDETENWIRDIAPGVRIVRTENCEVPFELILGLGQANRLPQQLTEALSTPHHHGHPFEVWAWTGTSPLYFEAIYEFFKRLPEPIIRGKGILHLQEVPHKRVVLQMVGHRVTLSKSSSWGDEPKGSQIVLIGAAGEFDAGILERQIASCTKPDPDRAPNRMADAVVQLLRRP
jgi:G3E family GTPase